MLRSIAAAAAEAGKTTSGDDMPAGRTRPLNGTGTGVAEDGDVDASRRREGDGEEARVDRRGRGDASLCSTARSFV